MHSFQNRRFLTNMVLALVLINNAGCSTEFEDGFVAPTNAEFRYFAREAYKALYMESCAPGSELRREKVLADERESVKTFEKRVAKADARQQLEIALSDIVYQQATNTLGCWLDEDPDFVQLHVKMAREEVKESLHALNELEPSLVPVKPIPYISSPTLAKFRAIARTIVEFSRPLCRMSYSLTNDQIMSPALHEINAFKNHIAGTPYAIHFEVASADAIYVNMITTVSCTSPAKEFSAKNKQGLLDSVKNQISLLEDIRQNN